MGDKSYRVTNIDLDKKLFSIEIPGLEDCGASNLRLRPNSPFRTSQQCSDDDGDGDEVMTLEINWSPPHEPLCNNSQDCKDWSHSTCKPPTINGDRRCMCHKKYHWDGVSLSCIQGKCVLALEFI